MSDDVDRAKLAEQSERYEDMAKVWGDHGPRALPVNPHCTELAGACTWWAQK